MNTTGYIYGINGSVIRVKGSRDFLMSEMVMVGKDRLVGEVIGVEPDRTTIQVFENTTGLKTQETVVGTGKPISVRLGPGIIGNIFDGIERPLKAIEEQSGHFIGRGVHTSSLDTDKKWSIEMKVKNGDYVFGGYIVATTKETESVMHKIMVPPQIEGVVVEVVADGDYTIEETILKVKDQKDIVHELTMVQEWPIRIPRPIKERYASNEPLVTGQRVIDTLFPIAKGGTAAIPGGFGTGKTMTQHQIAKWSNADIIIYIGCGERGNEMTQVLEEFAELVDPRTERPLLDRTVLIANTSNMPVAAREASIYTGITLAEYYRDMGYDVAIMADSTSRWAEALRELSGRLEEMPAEEGYPAYLSSRLAGFYERATDAKNLNDTRGSVTIIGAVSPQGGDFSEPVTQNTKRFVKCFWTLDRALAYARHFPAINWLTSYSEYMDDLESWYKKNVGYDFTDDRKRILAILTEESKLMEIVKLIGSDVLPDSQRLILEIARVVRLGFIQQNAYHKYDTYTPLIKQEKMMEVVLYLYEKSKALVETGITVSTIIKNDIFEKVISMKYDVDNEDIEKFDTYKLEIDKFYNAVYAQNA